LTPVKKHYTREVETVAVEPEQKILNLLQFARRAGQVVHGFEACKKNVANGRIKLLLLTQDIADNTKDKMMRIVETAEFAPKVGHYSSQEALSTALGLPWTCIIGVLDTNFAMKIQSYLTQ
jgi:ribosomal protein L7Ae-like RNA K-turn-binding protein